MILLKVILTGRTSFITHSENGYKFNDHLHRQEPTSFFSEVTAKTKKVYCNNSVLSN